MSYPKLFEPGKIGNLEIRNRIVMPAMGCSLAEVTGEPGPRMIRYYTDRAKGGAGLRSLPRSPVLTMRLV
ncbi:MAG: hypothetical protein IKD84_02825 [Erysipelotrichaceae bacterium]|nr:hypothetical protein [Erysipelotrichaceae bacterium]